MKTLTILMLIFSTNVMAHNNDHHHDNYTESQYRVNRNWQEYLRNQRHKNSIHVVHSHRDRSYRVYDYDPRRDTVGSIIVDILLRN